jgi:predicted transcriptional regulator
MDAQSGTRLMTAKIVGSYLRHHTVGTGELPDLIGSVHRALSTVGQLDPKEELLTPAVSVRQSVRHDYVVCLDCGYRGKTLRRHISSRHGLSRAEYLRRWGLQPDHPLTAPAYSERRSTLAKQLGLGRKPKEDAAPEPATAESAAPNAEGEVETGPRARRPTGSRSKSGVVKDAASEPKPRQRRPRSQGAPAQSEPSSTPTAEA